ncbi:MAG: polyketide synthase [Verrucomicrobiota bacterium]|jgi:acyl transferase domain-containing protein|nr:polyketide synthase [Verrucomicrobiota bacterium]
MRLSREDIVITGLSCRFAESPNLAAFWRNVMQRKSLLSPLTAPPPATVFDRPYPAAGACLGDLYACTPADQYFPRKINAGENQDVFFTVQLAIDALRDSGHTLNSLPTDRISFHLGYAPPFNAASVNWLQHTFFVDQTLDIVQKFFPGAEADQLGEIRRQLAASLPEPNPYAFLSALGSVISAWTAHLLGFAGPAFVVDAGAVSGHQALQGAMDDLILRRADIALAGALQPPFNNPVLQGLSGTLLFSRGKALQPFSREADGTLPGEGGAVFVLKRLKDALRAGDRIYAIIRSTGIAAAALDQHQRVPTPERLTRAITRAMRVADITPASVQLIEAHGSGIPHSDQTELQVLQALYGDRAPGQPLTGLGSVKGNIGHTLWASGAAGILKTALALAHRVLPPHVPVDRPITRPLPARSPLYLLGDARPWIRGDKKSPRRACVSAIDFTGTCAAAILEEYPEGT